MLKKITKNAYIYLLIALFYIPLFVGVVYSFSTGSKRGDMPINFEYSGEGWVELTTSTNIVVSFFNTLFIGIVVAIIVVTVGLITVFGLWHQKNRALKSFVSTTSNIPLINPDIITAISLTIAFGTMFGVLQRGENDYPHIIIAQSTIILPFAILVMLPRSEKFRVSFFEASKDLGYGPFKTWFKTYFRHMMPVAIGAFAIALALSFDDFIVARVVSRQKYTLGIQMYQSTLKPWVLAAGAIMLFLVLFSTLIFAIYTLRKQKQVRNGHATSKKNGEFKRILSVKK